MNPKLLMIDDDRVFCKLVQAVIGEEFDLEFRHTLRDGIQALKTIRPVAVLVDLVLPDSARERTVRTIKSEVTDEAIVVLSAFTTKETERQEIENNADGVVSKDKPLRFLPQEIANAVKFRNKRLAVEETIKRLDDPSI